MLRVEGFGVARTSNALAVRAGPPRSNCDRFSRPVWFNMSSTKNQRRQINGEGLNIENGWLRVRRMRRNCFPIGLFEQVYSVRSSCCRCGCNMFVPDICSSVQSPIAGADLADACMPVGVRINTSMLSAYACVCTIHVVCIYVFMCLCVGRYVVAVVQYGQAIQYLSVSRRIGIFLRIWLVLSVCIISRRLPAFGAGALTVLVR